MTNGHPFQLTFFEYCSKLSLAAAVLGNGFCLQADGTKLGIDSCLITNLSKRFTCCCSTIMNGRYPRLQKDGVRIELQSLNLKDKKKSQAKRTILENSI